MLPSIGPTQGIHTTPRETPRIRPPRRELSPETWTLPVNLELTAEKDALSLSLTITPPNANIMTMNSCRMTSPDAPVATPRAVSTPPIRVKVIPMPATIATGLRRWPTLPASSAGAMGSTQGENAEATPATNAAASPIIARGTARRQRRGFPPAFLPGPSPYLGWGSRRTGTAPRRSQGTPRPASADP